MDETQVDTTSDDVLTFDFPLRLPSDLNDRFTVLHERVVAAVRLYYGQTRRLNEIRNKLIELWNASERRIAQIPIDHYEELVARIEKMIDVLDNARYGGQERPASVTERVQEMQEEISEQMEEFMDNIRQGLEDVPGADAVDETITEALKKTMMEEKFISPYRLRNAMASENDPLIRVPRWNVRLQILEAVPTTLPYPTSRQALVAMSKENLRTVSNWYELPRGICRDRESMLYKLAGCLGVLLLA